MRFRLIVGQVLLLGFVLLLGCGGPTPPASTGQTSGDASATDKDKDVNPNKDKLSGRVPKKRP
jgi:hypothetical protein